MAERIDSSKVNPGAYHAMFGLEKYVRESGLELSLLDLVKIRASQINGCAFCLDMHWKDARAGGESEERLYMISVWRESALYSERERAALEWTEAITLVAENHVPDDLYEATRAVFDEREIISLTMAVIAINSWNRLSITFRNEPGHYTSHRQPAKDQTPTA